MRAHSLDIAAMPPPDWPASLNQLLAARGMSPTALAREAGVEPSTVIRWTDGSRPSRNTRPRLAAWCAANGLDLEQLLPRASANDGADGKVISLNARRAGGSRSTDRSTTPPTPEEPEMQTIAREYLSPEELAHFELPEDPFEDPVSPEDLYLPAGLVNVERQLQRAIQGRKIVALVAPPGAGKSALLRRLWAASYRQKRINLIAPALMDRRRVTLATLTVAMLRDLTDRDTSNMAAESRAQFLRTTLAAQVEAAQYPVLFLDEAHDLRGDALIAIKRLWDSHTLFRQLSVLMVGQAPLAMRLRTDPTLAELTGRTQILDLPGFAPDAVAAYLDWRFARVGAQLGASFETTALRAIADRSDRPLWINNLAVLALRYARSIGDRKVAAHHVGRV